MLLKEFDNSHFSIVVSPIELKLFNGFLNQLDDGDHKAVAEAIKIDGFDMSQIQVKSEAEHMKIEIAVIAAHVVKLRPGQKQAEGTVAEVNPPGEDDTVH